MKTQHEELISKIQSILPSSVVGMHDDIDFKTDDPRIVILIFPTIREIFVSMPFATNKNQRISRNIKILRFIRLHGFELSYIGYCANTFKFKF